MFFSVHLARIRFNWITCSSLCDFVLWYFTASSVMMESLLRTHPLLVTKRAGDQMSLYSIGRQWSADNRFPTTTGSQCLVFHLDLFWGFPLQNWSPLYHFSLHSLHFSLSETQSLSQLGVDETLLLATLCLFLAITTFFTIYWHPLSSLGTTVFAWTDAQHSCLLTTWKFSK